MPQDWKSLIGCTAKTIAEVLRKIYGNRILKLVRKFEKTNHIISACVNIGLREYRSWREYRL